MIELGMVRWRALLVLLGLLALAPRAAAQEPAPPGQFDYYLLTLSWSPAYCLAHRADPGARAECGRRRGFVVHGLWPQNEDGTWPAMCRPVPPVPADRAERETATMPNAELVQHEWSKHGSCTALTADGYFDALDAAFARLRIPSSMVGPAQLLALPLAEARSRFVAANPGLEADMFSMRCAHGGELVELRVCLDKSLNFRHCGAGAGDACPSMVQFVPILNAPD